MQKHLLYINLFAITSALALTACADEVENAVTPDMPEVGEKTPIELSVGGVDGVVDNGATRAVITTDPYSPKNYFDTEKDARVFMIMKSEWESLPSGNESYNYGGSHDSKYTVVRGDVAKNTNIISMTGVNTRYWDDAHARSSKLNIWAYAHVGDFTECTFEVPNAGGTEIDAYKDQAYNTTVENPWQTTEIYPAIRVWRASNKANSDAQDVNTIVSQDLYFSNNLVNNSSTGTNLSGDDNRLKFDVSSRHFPQEKEANMKFYHAMSKMTIVIKSDEGYKGDGTDFSLAGGIVKLTGFNKAGLFNLKTGQFEYIWNTKFGQPGTLDPNPWVIPQINYWKNEKVTTPKKSFIYYLRGLAVPNIHGTNGIRDIHSRFDENNNNTMMEFTIDNNYFKITSNDLYNALKTKIGTDREHVVQKQDGTVNFIPMEAGKNYVFTFVISKTKIKNISATIADWETVTADEQEPSNARITLNVEERTANVTKKLGSGDAFSLYLAKDDNTGTIFDDYAAYKWSSGYTTKVTPSYVSGDNHHWTTDLFWDSNLNFYHFRALCVADGTTNPTKVIPDDPALSSDSDGSQFLLLTHGETKNATEKYKDVCWGAPFIDVSGGNETDDASNLNWTYDPDTYGFDGKNAATTHQIYKAIGPTKDQIKLILFHMMSDVTFKVYTTTGDDMVDLGTGTTPNVTSIELQNIYTQGNLYLGNGLVKGSQTSKVNYPFTAKPAPDNTTKIITWGNYGAIPQTLEGVVLVITTADHNQYKVKLWDRDHPITATVTNKNLVNPYTLDSGSKYQINAWYPGFKYTYNFKLAKTGITDLTATVVDWEDVVADEDTVVIE